MHKAIKWGHGGGNKPTKRFLGNIPFWFGLNNAFRDFYFKQVFYLKHVSVKKMHSCFTLVAQICSVKKEFLEILQNSQENTCARVSFLIKF